MKFWQNEKGFTEEEPTCPPDDTARARIESSSFLRDAEELRVVGN